MGAADWANLDEGDWAKLDEEWMASGPTNDLERAWYRMPVGFGRTPGPRNIPASKRGGFVGNSRTSTGGVAALTDGDALQQLLPPGIDLRGEPLLSVGFLDNQFAFLNAGLSYVALIVSVQVTSHRHGEPVDGAYTLVEWHNRPDNMMTAREEIAYPSLWAELDFVPRGAKSYTGQAVWNGFRFLELRLDDLQDAMPQETRAASAVSILYKYVPRGYEDGAEFGRVVHNDFNKYYAAGGTADPAVQEETTTEQPRHRTGTGTFQWNRPIWQDMPTQFHVVNALADLPLLEFRPANYTSLPGVRTIPPTRK